MSPACPLSRMCFAAPVPLWSRHPHTARACAPAGRTAARAGVAYRRWARAAGRTHNPPLLPRAALLGMGSGCAPPAVDCRSGPLASHPHASASHAFAGRHALLAGPQSVLQVGLHGGREAVKTHFRPGNEAKSSSRSTLQRQDCTERKHMLRQQDAGASTGGTSARACGGASATRTMTHGPAPLPRPQISLLPQ